MPTLADPLQAGSLELKNRIVMPPMANDLSTEHGEVTEKLLEHYRRRAAADIGLVIVEHSYVVREGKMSRNQLGIYDDSLVEGLSRLAAVIREGGAKSAIQLTHAGANTSPDICGCQPVGPSDVPIPSRGQQPRPLEAGEIATIIDAYRAAARRAVDSGFDAIEIHGAHGFLLNEFTSPYTNHRTDQYGGSLENRLRMPLEVIAAVRAEAGDSFPLLYRFGASDFMQGGLTLEDGRQIAPRLVEAGIVILDISGGLCGSRPKELSGIQGFFVPLAETIRSAADVPVIAVGGISDAAAANAIVTGDRADLVAVGRELLKNPDWASEALAQVAGE